MTTCASKGGFCVARPAGLSGRAMPHLRKARIVRAFERAHRYDAHAHIQRVVASRLAERIGSLPLSAGAAALELGCGTGFLTVGLIGLNAGLSLTASDIAPAMLDRTRAAVGEGNGVRFAIVDAEDPHSSLAGLRYQLIASSLTLQWVVDLQTALRQIMDHVEPGGWLAFSTLLAGTFDEWTAARRAAGLGAATRTFPDLATLGMLLPDAAETSIEQYRLIDTYPTALGFLRSLRGIGAGSHWEDSQAHSPAGLREAMRRLEKDGVAITYEVAQVILRRR